MGKNKQPDEVTTVTEPWPGIVPWLTGGGTHYRPQNQMASQTAAGGFPFDLSQFGFQGFPGQSLQGTGYPGGFTSFGGIPGGSAGGPIGILPEAANLYRHGPGFTAPFDPLQQQAQQQTLDYAGAFPNLLQPYQDAAQGMLSGQGFNPYLDEAITAATRPIREQLTEDILPAIRGGATATGNVGSTRAGIAEGLAAGRSQDAIGDVSRRLSFDAFGKGLDQQARAMALYPQVLGAGLTPIDLVEGVGAQRRALGLEGQLDPYRRFQEFASIPLGLQGAGSSVTSPSYQQSGGLMGALGGAATGAGTAAALKKAGLTVPGPLGWGLTGLGALFGLF